MNRTTRISLIAVMLLATTALGLMTWRSMQPPPLPPKEEIVYKKPDPEPPPSCPASIEARLPRLKECPLSKDEKQWEYNRLTTKAARLHGYATPKYWEFIYATVEKEPDHYIKLY